MTEFLGVGERQAPGATGVAAAQARLRSLGEQYEQLLLERRATDNLAVMLLTGSDARGGLAQLGAGAIGSSSVPTLAELAAMDRTDLATLLRLNPDLLDLLSAANPPESVAAWWGALDEPQQTALVLGASGVIGALGGVPPLARVAANRVNAAREIPGLDDQITALRAAVALGRELDVPMSEQQSQFDALLLERSYLERAVNGDVQLYLYDKSRDSSVEMLGDPYVATRVVSYVPGTRAVMEDFYLEDPFEEVTGFARRQLELAPDGRPIVAFVFKDGFFPQTDDLLRDGPQYNGRAEMLGRNYQNHLLGIEATLADRPIVSIEHSFGTAVAGAAEAREGGAPIDARVLLAGIGMRSNWEAQAGTEYYAFQAADDMNTYLDGMEAGGFGYEHTPTAENGITELDSGLDTPYEDRPFWYEGHRISNGLHNHGLIAGADLEENGTVLRRTARIIENVN